MNTDLSEQRLIKKLRRLPPEKAAAVEDFVDFLCQRESDRGLSSAAMRLSQEVFRKVWDNPDDAEYDGL